MDGWTLKFFMKKKKFSTPVPLVLPPHLPLRASTRVNNVPTINASPAPLIGIEFFPYSLKRGRLAVSYYRSEQKTLRRGTLKYFFFLFLH